MEKPAVLCCGFFCFTCLEYQELLDSLPLLKYFFQHQQIILAMKAAINILITRLNGS